MSLIKELLNSAKGEDIHIFQMVDEHVCEIAVKVSNEKVDEYLKFRKEIAHERVDSYERKVGLKRELTETEIDLETPQKKGRKSSLCTSNKEGVPYQFKV